MLASMIATLMRAPAVERHSAEEVARGREGEVLLST
jgi:hypothetical protein